MKKYNVTFGIADGEIIKGEKSWYEVVQDELDQEVQAEDEREAILLAVDYIAECLSENMDRYHTYDINDDKDEITIYNADGEAVELYYDFEAEEVEEEIE